MRLYRVSDHFYSSFQRNFKRPSVERVVCRITNGVFENFSLSKFLYNAGRLFFSSLKTRFYFQHFV